MCTYMGRVYDGLSFKKVSEYFYTDYARQNI